MKTSLRKNAGFTLLEIMLVVVIISLLIGLGVVRMGGKIEEAKIVRARGDIQQLITALLMYQSNTGALPSSDQGMKALITKPEGVRNWRQQLDNEMIDPWNKAYIYLQPGTHNPKTYDIYSSGPDGLPNTTDDIGNWEPTGN